MFEVSKKQKWTRNNSLCLSIRYPYQAQCDWFVAKFALFVIKNTTRTATTTTVDSTDPSSERLHNERNNFLSNFDLLYNFMDSTISCSFGYSHCHCHSHSFAYNSCRIHFIHFSAHSKHGQHAEASCPDEPLNHWTTAESLENRSTQVTSTRITHIPFICISAIRHVTISASSHKKQLQAYCTIRIWWQKQQVVELPIGRSAATTITRTPAAVEADNSTNLPRPI